MRDDVFVSVRLRIRIDPGPDAGPRLWIAREQTEEEISEQIRKIPSLLESSRKWKVNGPDLAPGRPEDKNG